MDKKIEHTGDKIRKHRLAQNLTQKELGQKCNMYESQIRKYETGKANPKRETLQKIAIALNIPLESLYSDLEIANLKITRYFDSLLDTNKNILQKKEKLEDAFFLLNDLGQDKAIEQVELLAKIPEYKANVTTSGEIKMKLDESGNLSECLDGTETDEAPEQDPTHRPAQN